MVIISTSFLWTQNIILSESVCDFGNILSNETNEFPLTITNTSSINLNLQITFSNSEFSVQNNEFFLEAGNSETIDIQFIGVQNIQYNELMYLTDEENGLSKCVNLLAVVHHSNSFYSSTYNLYDNNLKNELTSLVENHTNLGYNTARDRMFDTIDNVNGTIECVYTGLVINAENRTQAQNQGFNTEHTWPQSMGATGAAKSDLFHLYPTEGNANSVRGSYPFGDAVSNITWQEGGSKRGNNSSGSIVFEPRDIHKGNCARSMFYFSLVYSNPNNFLNSQEATLREWSVLDMVDTKEIDRNNDIEYYQNNRNPFIDYPSFLDRIYSISTNSVTPQNADYFSPLNSLNFGISAVNLQDTLFFVISNQGNANLLLNDISVNDPHFVIGDYQTSITSGTFQYIPIVFSSDSINNFSGELSISTNDGSYNYEMTASTSLTGNTDIVEDFKRNKITVFPNPFFFNNNRSEISIDFSIEKPGFVEINAYDIKGRLVERIFSGKKFNQNNSIQWNAKSNNSQKISSGIYFIIMQTETQKTAEKIMIIK